MGIDALLTRLFKTRFFPAALQVFVVVFARASAGLPHQQLVLLASVPMIPLLLLSHFGYLSAGLLADGGMLVSQVAGLIGAPSIAADSFRGAGWARYFGPLCTVLVLCMALLVSKWALSRSPLPGSSRAGVLFGLFYVLFAAVNLAAAWPGGAGAPAAMPASAAAQGPDSWSVLWPFHGINAAIVALVLIARRQKPDSAKEVKDFSASHNWTIRDGLGMKQTEIYKLLVEQAVQARWQIPAVVCLGNAAQEIITFLQRPLPAGSPITVNAILRKNKAVLTISPTGQPLTLPDYKAPPSLDDADETMDGIELRLAVAQIEHMSYQARLSEGRCSFTLRQGC